MRSLIVSVLAAASTLGLPSTLEAQFEFGSERSPSRFQLGGDFVVAQPKGELADNIDNGFGFNGTGMFRLDPKGFLSLRADIGGVQYGRETFRVPFHPLTGRVDLDVETTNTIAWGGIGGHLQIPDGWIRPYANASIAYTHFSTESALKGTNDDYEYASTTNQSDGSRAWIFGGGLVIPFGSKYALGGLNLGARYYYGGNAEYLREGDIIDNPDGTVTLDPRNSKTDLVLWQLGVSFVLPRGR
ncbi:MAG TPA: outer membrane beta-barrel protein [Gemmatimonadaceae bacterium]|nr:outer membrane beta-barrel protein [Gemmatimonadaceae bacterium]